MLRWGNSVWPWLRFIRAQPRSGLQQASPSQSYYCWDMEFLPLFSLAPSLPTSAGSIGTSLAIASGNTLESLVGAYLINRWSDGCSTFDTPSGVTRFALICFIPSTMISATFGVGILSLEG